MCQLCRLIEGFHIPLVVTNHLVQIKVKILCHLLVEHQNPCCFVVNEGDITGCNVNAVVDRGTLQNTLIPPGLLQIDIRNLCQVENVVIRTHVAAVCNRGNDRIIIGDTRIDCFLGFGHGDTLVFGDLDIERFLDPCSALIDRVDDNVTGRIFGVDIISLPVNTVVVGIAGG